MKVRYDLEIRPRGRLDVDAEDMLHCRDLHDLEYELCDWIEPEWSVDFDQDDLTKLWEKIQELKGRE